MNEHESEFTTYYKIVDRAPDNLPPILQQYTFHVGNQKGFILWGFTGTLKLAFEARNFYI